MFRQDRVSDQGAGRWIHFREASHSTQSNNSDYVIVPITEGQPEMVTGWNSEAQTSERELMVRLPLFVRERRAKSSKSRKTIDMVTLYKKE